MELLYLRINDTKTAHRLSFVGKDINFDGKHSFRLNEENGLIEYYPNIKYNGNLYGEDIKVTGLIGGNGVGKSTFLKFLQYLIAKMENLERDHDYRDFELWEWVAIVNTKDGLALTTGHEYISVEEAFGKEYNSVNITPFVFQPTSFPNFGAEPNKELSCSVYYSPHLDLEEPNFDSPDYINVSSDFIIYHESRSKEDTDQNISQIINFRKNEIRRQIEFMQFAESNQNDEIIFYKEFNRETINLEFNQFIKKFDSDPRYIAFEDIELYQRIDDQFLKYSNDLNYRIRRKKSGTDGELAKLWFSKRLFEVFYYNIEYRGASEIDSNYRVKLTEQFVIKENVVDIQENLISFFTNQLILDGNDNTNLALLIVEINSYLDNYLKYNEDNKSFTCSLKVAKKLISLEKKVLKILPYDQKLPLFVFDWSGMSTGEKAYLNLFSRLHYGLEELSEHPKIKQAGNIYFLIDEPSTGFHPQWQKEYLNKLLSFLKVRMKGNIHLIISSHSPFLVSDLQREDVVTLSIENKLNSNIENTFGANIHELLADNFFLQDGFIGDFARNKIQDLIKFLTFNPDKPESESNIKYSDEWSEESAMELILIIGEPLIKERLLAIFEKKFTSKSELLIKAKIEELNRQLDQLKS